MCERCPLSALREELGFKQTAGFGSQTPEILFIAINPPVAGNQTLEKSWQGGFIPFYRKDEQQHLFYKALREAGLIRGDSKKDLLSDFAQRFYITNIIKCPTPANRAPKKQELAACRQTLLAEVEALKPKLICALGRLVTENLPAEIKNEYRVFQAAFPKGFFSKKFREDMEKLEDARGNLS